MADSVIVGTSSVQPATLPVPALTSSVGADGNVRVKWTLVGEYPRASAVLELERATGTQAFAPLKRLARPKAIGSFLDKQPPAGPIWYRARLLTGIEASAWCPPYQVPGSPPQPPPPEPPPSVGQVDEVLRLVNAARKTAGVPPLVLQPQLVAAARQRAKDLAAAGILTHTGYDATIRASGYTGWFAENIACGYATAQGVVQGWLGSPAHKNNIMSGWTETGIGEVNSWWVQVFGTPR